MTEAPLQEVCNYEAGAVADRLSEMARRYAADFPDGYGLIVRSDGAIHLYPLDRIGIVEWRPEVLPE